MLVRVALRLSAAGRHAAFRTCHALCHAVMASGSVSLLHAAEDSTWPPTLCQLCARHRPRDLRLILCLCVGRMDPLLAATLRLQQLRANARGGRREAPPVPARLCGPPPELAALVHELHIQEVCASLIAAGSRARMLCSACLTS